MIDTERKGRLKSWDDDKGFGFIQPQDGGAEVFAHIPEVNDYFGARSPQGRDSISLARAVCQRK